MYIKAVCTVGKSLLTYRIIDAPQAVEVVGADALGELDAVPELDGLAYAEVLLCLDGLAAHVNHLVEEQRSSSLGQVFHLTLYKVFVFKNLVKIFSKAARF